MDDALERVPIATLEIESGSEGHGIDTQRSHQHKPVLLPDHEPRVNPSPSQPPVMLSGVNVALGVTGSIAAVRTTELAHELRRRGASVRAVMTEGAPGSVHPWAVEFGTDHDVVTELTGSVEHVELCGRAGWADVLLIAPATANTVGKVAAAIDDSPVTTCATTALGADLPVVVAPAMHEPMYDHPGVLEAIDRVESWGVSFVDPRIEEGKAKIATTDTIALETARAVHTDPSRSSDGPNLTDERIVVTAGATAEPIDPVRVLTNRSSGRMGRAVARACYVAGADVTLVHGQVGPQPLERSRTDDKSDDVSVPYATFEQVETTDEMIDTVESAAGSASALVSVAAIGDFTTEAHDGKLRSGEERTLTLEPTRKLIDTVREQQPELPIVGFKTETSGDDDAMIEAARETIDRVDLAFVVANDASVMGATDTRAMLVTREDATVASGPKSAVAGQIRDRVAATIRSDS
jgi:phosphopantothenoylcysteine decarboxylase/phosphopantothenate--cysteine ligase